jgi:hypothetical protein
MSNSSPAGGPVPSFGRFTLAVALASSLLLASVVLAPATAVAADYPPNYNPLMVISDDNWRAGTSMSQGEIQAFLETQDGVLKSYACAEGGPNGAHSGVVKPASQIIAEAAQYWNVNPKLIIATLEKEQSLITQPWHVATATHLYGTDYHLTNAMGCGVYAGSPDRHPGFGDQVWTGTEKLGAAPLEGSTSPYRWWPGKIKTVYSYEHAANIDIVPLNQPTWNAYTYTPYYPQISVWKCYSKFFGDPLAYPGKAPIYRFYNKKNGSHFYTASEAERYTVITKWPDTYSFEGPAYSVNTTSPANSAPLYRFYNKKNGSHFYTASLDEANSVIMNLSRVYDFEGPAYNVSMTPVGSVPVYRFYRPASGSHFYTISLDEANSVILKWPTVYNFEGIAYYVALSD